MAKLNINGKVHDVKAEADTPLLWVLRDILGLTGTKYGCGIEVCGACTVIVRGQAIRSCVTPVGTIGNAEITTLEGLGTPEKPHALQAAFIDEQARQLGIGGRIARGEPQVAIELGEHGLQAALAGDLGRDRFARARDRVEPAPGNEGDDAEDRDRDQHLDQGETAAGSPISAHCRAPSRA